MSAPIIVQYVGFEVGALAREYFFDVREIPGDSSEYTLIIPLAAFDTHRIRLQDAPDLCSRVLERELAASANHPPMTHFSVTNAEIEDYQASHPRKPAKK